MTCYHPNIRIEDLTKWETAKDGHKYHPAKVFSAVKWSLEEQAYLKHNGMTSWKAEIIPCQKCIGCRLENSRQWANRAFMEAKMWKQSWFVTLTYDENHLPTVDEITTSNDICFTDENGKWQGILVPKDLQQFQKNLRQIMKREYNQDNIRIMACGEYGGKGDRPHYHLIIFNCNLPQDSFYNPKVQKEELYWQNYIIERAWGGIRGKDWEYPLDPNSKGKSNISEATWNNMAYVGRYITKKQNGPGSEEDYAAKGQIKEFFRASNKPGIGKPYFDKYYKEIYKNDEIIIKNKRGSIQCKPPRYFDDLFKEIDPKRMAEIKAKRKRLARDTAKIKDRTTSLDRLSQLEIEEREKIETTQQLIRIMELQM